MDTKKEHTVDIAATGIAGLDKILRGGFPRNRLYLVEGNPGTGKTTLALQFLLEGVRQGETALYVTLSETKEELFAVARSHGWSLDGITIYDLAVPDNLLPQEGQSIGPTEFGLISFLSLIDFRPSGSVNLYGLLFPYQYRLKFAPLFASVSTGSTDKNRPIIGS